MEITNNKEERAKQRQILRRKYPDYDYRYHDAFLLDYIEQKERREREKRDGKRVA